MEVASGYEQCYGAGMGLDTSHDCWHGSYHAFGVFRRALAKAAGLPDLDSMEGFGSLSPIRWDSLPPDPIHVLLNHSDCEDDIAVEHLVPLAERLDSLALVLEQDPEGARWAKSARQFAAGCRDAADEGVPVEFM
jgi:hypothetical protein